MSHNFKYRPEIDGWRGISILMVVIYHAFPDLLPYGYLGVDIFFVISGFLITGITLNELGNGTFSAVNFYIRRIKRILPTALVVLFCTSVFGLFTLHTDEIVNLQQYIRSAAFFYTNIQSASEIGYFAVNNNFKPLMHYWSLAVEEQYYLIWPLVLFLFATIRKYSLSVLKTLLYTLSVFIFLSSAADFKFDLIQAIPGRNYYSLFSRLWQLMLGGGLAILLRHEPGHRFVSRLNHHSLVNFGLLSVVFFGLSFLLPNGTSASFMLVAAIGFGLLNTEKNWLNQFLQMPVLVFVGMISYAWYLWHWPLLSFVRIFSYQPTTLTLFILVLAGFGLSVITYFLIEKPLRRVDWQLTPPHHTWTSTQLKPFALLMGCVLLFIASFQLKALNDKEPALNSGIGKEALYSGPCLVGEANDENLAFCQSSVNQSPVQALVIGDSHANSLFPGLVETFPNIKWYLVAHKSCLAFGEPQDHKKGCQSFMRQALDKARQRNFQYVFVVNSDRVFESAFQKQSINELVVEYQKYLDPIFQNNQQLFIFQPVPEIIENINVCSRHRTPFIQRWLPAQPSVCRIEKEEWMKKANLMRNFNVALSTQLPYINVIDPTDILCDDQYCYASREYVYYTDKDHLSVAGSRLVATQLIPYLTH